MANLSNINGKFVVEQTTGYVGVGTTDPNFLIEAAGANSEIALNSTSASVYRLRSTSSDSFIITKNGVGDRLVINGAGNATFAGKIIAPKLSIQNQINTTSSNLEINYENGDGTTTNFKDFYVRDGKNAVILNIQGSSKNATFAGNISGVNATFNGGASANATPLTIGSSSQTTYTLQQFQTSSHGTNNAYLIAYGAGHNSQAGNFAMKNTLSGKNIFFEVDNSRELIIENGSSTFAGNVGIGVTAHGTASLNITNANQHIRLNNGSELGIISLLSGGELDIWGHGTDETINFRTGTGSGTVAMNITGVNSTFAGNIQLGGATPTLNFYKTANADILANIKVESDTGTGGRLTIQTKRNGNTPVDALVIDDNQNATFAGNVLINSGYIKLGGYSYIGEDLSDLDSLTIASDHTESIHFAHFTPATSTYSTNMIIDSSGRVGIGTTGPSYKLEVQGDTYINGRDFGKPINYATAQGWTAISSNLNSVTGFFGGAFNRNGASNENKIEWDYNYAGQRALIWRTQNNDAGSNDDGGWNKNITVASNNMGYMSVVYVKRNTSSSNGTFYHGCSGTNTLYLNGNANGNPYFHNFGVGTLPQDVWCISIGFLQANNDSNTANNPAAGVYRLDTGAKVHTGSSTFKMGTDSQLRQSHRVYLYYSTDVNQNLSFSDPGFYALDGSQPSISDLFGAGVPTPSSSSPFGQALKTYSSSAVVTVATTVNASTVSPKVSGHITITASTGASIIVKTFGIYETSNWWFKDEASPDIENGNNDIEITCSGNATNTLTFTVGDPTPVAGYGMTVSIQASPPGFFNL